MHRPAVPNPPTTSRGMTLVELMIVIAIIGILAAIGLVSFTSYVEEGHLTELRQYVMEVEQGQEQYFSRHHHYLAIDDHGDGNDGEYAHDAAAWTQLLEFDHGELPDHITVRAEGSGDPDDTQSCDDICPGTSPDDDDIWFAACAGHDDVDRDIYYDNNLDQPMEVDSCLP